MLEPTLLSAAMYAPHHSAWACDWDGVDADRNSLADTIDRLHEEADQRGPSVLSVCSSISDDAQLQKAVAMGHAPLCARQAHGPF